MRRYLTYAALGALFCIPAAGQKPTPEQQRQTLDTAREIAIHYASKLPGFICNEQVERTDQLQPNGRLLTVFHNDHLIIQLSYAGQKENYKLVSIDGSPTTQPLSSLDGIITGGEFGSLQLGVFDPSSAADFQWKETTTLRKHRAAVYTYRIARANSHYMLGSRLDDGKLASVAAGYHGEVVLDLDTSRVLRLTADADDIPKETGITVSSMQVDYDFVDVAGGKHLLPSHSDTRMEHGDRKLDNVVTYTAYRKFEVDSSIDFGKQ
jgi:hypothetical protein